MAKLDTVGDAAITLSVFSLSQRQSTKEILSSIKRCPNQQLRIGLLLLGIFNEMQGRETLIYD